MFIYAYKQASESAKALRQAAKLLSIKHENSKFKGSPKKVVLNWGSSTLPPEALKCKVLNHPDAVKKAIDKRSFFEANQEHSVPFTLDKEQALNWLEQGKTVVIREQVKGHGGEGISIITNKEEFKDAPLYTLYIPKKEEYRLHVFNGEVFFVQRKARIQAVRDENVNWKVRNMAGGFIFANKDVEVSDVAEELAIACVKNLGLDFGAVDIIYNERQDKYFALEVNTSPGLAGTTLEKYCEQFGKEGN